MMSKQNFVDMMTQHRLKRICSVDNTRSLDSEMSSELPNASCTKFFGQQVFNVAHVDVSMNLSGKWQVSNNVKKVRVIKTLALKWKVKCHFMKWGDNASKVANITITLCFCFLQVGSSCFLFPKWALKKSCGEIAKTM